LLRNHRRSFRWHSQAWQASLIPNLAPPMAFEWLAMSGEMQLRFASACAALPLASALRP
jgi:hypothetical protein